jgi:hypothetical protein
MVNLIFIVKKNGQLNFEIQDIDTS